MSNKRFTVPTIITVLLAAIFLPVVLTGSFELHWADSKYAAGDYAAASASFERAIYLLPWRDDLWEKAGIATARAGEHRQALEYFRHVSRFTEEGWTWFALSHMTLGDFDTAGVVLRRGLQFYDSPSLYSLLSVVYLQKNDMQGQRDVLENLIRLNPGDANAHYRLGLLLTVLEPEQALTYLMQASSLDPQYDSAVHTLRSALNLSATQPDASQQMVTDGRALGLVHEWKLSAAAFEKAISLDEKNAQAWAWLGEAKQQIAGLTGEAASKSDVGLAELDKAAAFDHTSVVVRGLRALYWGRHQEYGQMLMEYTLASLHEPTNPAWMAGMAEAYVKRGNLVAALTSYRRATELAPNESTYWTMLAIFCAQNNVYLEDIGLPAAQKAVEISPDDPSALDALGWVYLASGRLANAEQTLLDVTKRFPENLSARIHLSMTYLAQGNRSAAFETLKAVQAADPGGAYGQMAGQLLKQYFP